MPAGASAGVPRPDRRTVSLPRARTPDVQEGHFYEAPIGTRRAGRSYAPQPGAGGPGHRSLTVPGAGGGSRGRGRRRWWIALAALVLIGAAIAFVAFKLFQPGHGDGTGRVRVVVPQGSTASQVGDLLAERGVVDSSFFFGLRARLAGQRSDLRAGTFTLRRDMSYAAALDALTTAPKAAPVVDVTLPEGPSRRELAPIVRQAGVSGDYLAGQRPLVRAAPARLRRPARDLEPRGLPLPGHLRAAPRAARPRPRSWPSSCRPSSRTSPRCRFAKARRRNLSRYDVLIIASMIEREARLPRERRLVASVIYNRLRQDIPLGIDATTRYATHNWTRPLKQSELTARSPYNTRSNLGLPPTPIGNPGLASIQAAADPASTKDLYYVVKPCGDGAHSFSATKAQFDRDVAAYDAKRAALGGKDPSRC